MTTLNDISDTPEQTTPRSQGCTLAEYLLIIYKFNLLTTKQLTDVLDAYFYDTI
jgi:hypothetical protein